eukprot:gene3111-biopygen1614
MLAQTLFLVLFLFPALLQAFRLSPLKGRSNLPSALQATSEGQVFDPKKQVGSSAPLGFFDPLGFSNGISESLYKRYQESEIKHGRVAMLAALGFFFGEAFHPLFHGEVSGPAIFEFQKAEAIFHNFWIPALVLVSAVEGRTIAEGWESPEETFKNGPSLGAKLRSDYEPGNLGFDPLGLRPKSPAAYADLKTKELNNGRLAMVGVLGLVVQELITQQPVFSFSS